MMSPCALSQERRARALLLHSRAVEALREIWRCGIAEWKWASAECVGHERSPVREIAGGFEDDDPVGLAGDNESKLVRDNTEANQVERLIFIRADVHRAAQGIVTATRLAQYRKAEYPITLTRLPIMTLVRLMQL
mgnify:CR=1 FL=1